MEQANTKKVSNRAVHPASINWAPTVCCHVPDADTRRTVAQLSYSTLEDKQHISLEMNTFYIGDCQFLAVFDLTRWRSHMANLLLFNTIP